MSSYTPTPSVKSRNVFFFFSGGAQGVPGPGPNFFYKDIIYFVVRLLSKP